MGCLAKASKPDLLDPFGVVSPIWFREGDRSPGFFQGAGLRPHCAGPGEHLGRRGFESRKAPALSVFSVLRGKPAVSFELAAEGVSVFVCFFLVFCFVRAACVGCLKGKTGRKPPVVLGFDSPNLRGTQMGLRQVRVCVEVGGHPRCWR